MCKIAMGLWVVLIAALAGLAFYYKDDPAVRAIGKGIEATEEYRTLSLKYMKEAAESKKFQELAALAEARAAELEEYIKKLDLENSELRTQLDALRLSRTETEKIRDGYLKMLQ
ncbi:hypothetical protein C4J81_09205 [Deltaproteobacteria bacterium Smac51]|nr:hypothetical protein C4J81_09205 [Deltaproteobacteria bacterium Smac51]